MRPSRHSAADSIGTGSSCTCERFGAQILSLGATFGGQAGGFEGARAAAQDEGELPGPRLWQGRPRGAAAGEGGRRVNRLEGTSAIAPGTKPEAIPTRSCVLPAGASRSSALGTGSPGEG